MSRAKIGAIIMSALLLTYVALLSNTALALLATGETIGLIMGACLVAFPVIGVWAIAVELRFGLAAEKLVARVIAEGAWPDLGIETRPSGRPIRASADAAFAKWSAAAEENDTDFHAWFNLSLAYDACGDRLRARAAMRKAIALAN